MFGPDANYWGDRWTRFTVRVLSEFHRFQTLLGDLVEWNDMLLIQHVIMYVLSHMQIDM